MYLDIIRSKITDTDDWMASVHYPTLLRKCE